jgi:hypothetical protein
VMKNRLWRVAWATFCAIVLGLLAFPVSRIPGYELSTGVGLVLAFTGGAFGVAFGQHESTRAVTSPWGQVLAAWSGACAVLVVPIGLTALAAIVVTVATSPCSPFDLLHFVPVIVGPSIALVAAAGVAIGLTVRRFGGLVLAWLGVVLLSAVHTVWPILTGPQVFAYNHLAGFLPGPIYDEELELPSALLWFRLGTLLITALALLLAVVRVGGRTTGRTRAAVALAIGVIGLELLGPTLGFRMTDSALEARLGGRTETDHVVLIHPRGLTPRELQRISSDVEFRFRQIAAFIGGAPKGKVRVWWYRSAEQKQALVGAAHTQFAKPWRREVHVNESAFPHPVLKHELAHALLGPLGAPPFGVTARGLGLLPHVGIIEGLAVAADNPVDDLSLQQWAAAMKRQQLLPDVRESLGLTGFYAQSGARAYTTAGAFLRWLGDTRGADRLKALYRDGDFAGVYGEGLPALATAWETFLDTVPLEPEAVNQAFARFRRGSLFERPCAREVARLSEQVGHHSNDDVELALTLLARCQALQPLEPAHELGRVPLLRWLGRDDEAQAGLEALIERTKDTPSAWGEAALVLVDLKTQRGDGESTRALLEELIARQISPAIDRTAHVRLHALDAPSPVREAITLSFSRRPEPAQVLGLTRALSASPNEPVVAYLLGRRLHQREAFAEALPFLTLAADAELWPSVTKEALRLAIEAAFHAGRCDEVRRLAEQAARRSSVFGARAFDWVERCDAPATAPAPTRTAP